MSVSCGSLWKRSSNRQRCNYERVGFGQAKEIYMDLGFNFVPLSLFRTVCDTKHYYDVLCIQRENHWLVRTLVDRVAQMSLSVAVVYLIHDHGN